MNKKHICEMINQMTLEEKVAFTVGKDFWKLTGLERLEIPSIMVTDGPHGLRKQAGLSDHLGLNSSNPAICFPAGCALASSFDSECALMMGEELGKIARYEDVAVVLGPAMNIKRSPLCGRNFEYYSEDPYLSTTMATGMITGVQSQCVGTSPKHFLANNQEYFRMSADSVVDERTLREIYLASFEGAVKEAKPWTMMCSYNKINGTYASENKNLLNDILRNEWGYDGCVLTDWGACDDPVDSMKAGLDLEMPGPANGNQKLIIEAVNNGSLPLEVLNQAVERVLSLIFKCSNDCDRTTVYDFEHGHSVAKKLALESAVLLKNDDKCLPLSEKEKVLVIGAFAQKPRFQGGGSSHINPYRISNAWDIMKVNENVSYVQGYGNASDDNLLQEAIEAAKQVDKIVIFAGLPDSDESEGFDRKHLNLPACQNRLIKAVSKFNSNIVVVLHNGSPVTMPWINDVKSVLELYLSGEAVGEAAVDLLYGYANPCGHLAETFPLRLEDTPTYPYFGVEREKVVYREGVLVGYRYYETMKKEVLFPFGHGLSYTEFEYSNLKLSSNEISDTDKLKLSVDVKNIGGCVGKTVVQIYVSAPKVENIIRPERELRAYKKVKLEAGEKKTVEFTLEKRAFAYWNVEVNDWYVPTGVYAICVGTSANTMVLCENVKVNCTMMVKPVFTVNTPMKDLMSHPIAAQVLAKVMSSLRRSSALMSVEDAPDTDSEAATDVAMSKASMEETGAAFTLRSLVSFSPDMDPKQIQQIIDAINRAVENS